MSDSMLRTALALSAALHGLFGWWVEVRGSARPPAWREVADSWTGPGIEVDAVVVPQGVPAETSAARDATAAEAADQAAATPTAQVPSAAEATRGITGLRDANTSHDANGIREPEVTRPAKKPSAAARAVPATPPKEPSRTAATRSHAADASGSGDVEASPSSSASDATATNAASAAATPSGAFGAQGLPQGVRHLPKAFTRALSIADRSDPRWLTLPPGPAGEARVEIPVDDEGKLGELAYRDETERARLAPVVRHLLENTRLLLESGHFSLDPAALRAGIQRLRVRVEVVEATGTTDADGDPNGLKELEYEAPTANRPGRGSFALNSGRRVIGWVYVE
jgi:hypothetical protein